MNDIKIIKQYKHSKDLKLLQQLYLSYQPYIYRHCMSILKHAHDSEDACVEIFLILKEKLIEHEVEYFPSWLYMLSRNHCLKKLRIKRRIILEPQNKIKDKSESVEKVDHYDKYLLKLPDAIDQLKENQRKCIVLFFFHGKSYKEIEDILGVPFKKIKSSIQHGKKNLLKSIMTE